MDGSSDKSRYEHAVQIAFTLHGGFLVVVILILGIGPLLKIGESVGAIRPAACLLAAVGVVAFMLMRRTGASFQKFVKRWADLIWNVYSMSALYFAFSSAVEFGGTDLKVFLTNSQTRHPYIFPALEIDLFLTAALRGAVAAYEIWPPKTKPEPVSAQNSNSTVV